MDGILQQSAKTATTSSHRMVACHLFDISSIHFVDMITGVEVAGLSLAILPLIVSALEHYNDGTRPLKDFVKYRCLIRIMVIDLGTQSELLRNSIEKLLDGLVSDTEIATLLENPAGPAWRERSLATRLEKRLAGAYMVYMESIKNILILLEDLRDKIGLDENGQVIDAIEIV